MLHLEQPDRIPDDFCAPFLELLRREPQARREAEVLLHRQIVVHDVVLRDEAHALAVAQDVFGLAVCALWGPASHMGAPRAFADQEQYKYWRG